MPEKSFIGIEECAEYLDIKKGTLTNGYTKEEYLTLNSVSELSSIYKS